MKKKVIYALRNNEQRQTLQLLTMRHFLSVYCSEDVYIQKVCFSSVSVG